MPKQYLAFCVRAGVRLSLGHATAFDTSSSGFGLSGVEIPITSQHLCGW